MKLYGHPEKSIIKSEFHPHSRASFHFKFRSPYGRIITVGGVIKDKHHPCKKAKELYHALKHIIKKKHGGDIKRHILKEATLKKLSHDSYLKEFNFNNTVREAGIN